jgi:hypothetical protein
MLYWLVVEIVGMRSGIKISPSHPIIPSIARVTWGIPPLSLAYTSGIHSRLASSAGARVNRAYQLSMSDYAHRPGGALKFKGEGEK